MRAVLVTVGSRGDAEPFCALAAEMLRRDEQQHDVHLFMQTDQQKLAPPGATVHTLPFSSNDFYKYTANPSKGNDSPNPRVRFTGIIADVVAELVLPCTKDILAVSRGADAIVSSSLARVPALLVGRELQVPVAIVHLQPLVPTKDYPHYSDTEATVDAMVHPRSSPPADCNSHLDSHWTLERVQHEFLEERVSAACEELGFPPLEFEGFMKPALAGGNPGVMIANSFSTEVVPPTTDAGDDVHDVGPLADAYVSPGWEPPKDLAEFLNGCQAPPVCVGFGSMPCDKASLVIAGLKQTGDKAVLVGDALKLAEDEDTDTLFQISSVPYPWLLPQCSMMISHGGAGVVNATLRAGVPPVIFPFFGDQPFWAALLVAKGIGVQACPLGALTADDVVGGVRKARECQAKAKAVGEAICARPKNGAQALTDLLEARCSR